MKLAEIKSQAIQPTELEGVFVRDLSLEKIEELGKLENTEEGMEAVVWMFNNLICDSDGELFEDALTVEDIRQHGVLTIKAISEAATNALQQGGKS